MKNYILFSTNNSNAVDNVSFCIETTLESREAINKIRNVCKYNSITVTPIGEPMSGCLELNVALEEIKKIVLHCGIEISSGKTPHIVSLPDGVIVEHDPEDNTRPLLKINKQFSNDSVTLPQEEHAIVGKLLDMFPTLHYNKSRSTFGLYNRYNAPTPKTTGFRGVYGIVGNNLVYIYEELTMKLEEI